MRITAPLRPYGGKIATSRLVPLGFRKNGQPILPIAGGAPVQVLSDDEIREALEQALDAAEAADVALQNVPPDIGDDDIVELKAKYDQSLADVAKHAAAVERRERMKAALAQVPRSGDDGDGGKKTAYGTLGRTGEEPRTYRRGGRHSFIHDVFNVTQGDPGAAARLQRHSHELSVDMGIDVEQYAMTTGSGSGVGFVPPQYLQDEWTPALRAARPLADAIGSRPLPDVGTTFNIPRITTGAVTAVQASEGSAPNDSSDVTDTVALPVSTIAGKVDMSRQLFDRSQPGMDDVIMEDLASDYGLRVDSEVINGSGSGGRVKGILSAASSNTISATATAVGIYPKVADAGQRIDTQRFLPADLLVMHPRRWAQFLAALDSSSRPLVVPNPVGFNTMAQGQPNPPYQPSQGFVGYDMQGLPVLKDANIPTNLGAATNEDRIIVTRKEDLYLFESGAPVLRAYEEVLSGTLQVRILAFGYIAFTAERVAGAVSTFLITGLTPPSF